MATPDALTALTHSAESWNRYRDGAPGPIDLSLAQLDGEDLRGRTFSFCDLSGASLNSANLDFCSFEHTSLNDALIRNASFVSCRFDHVDARGVLLEMSVMRNSKFVEVNFAGANLNGVKITDCTVESTIFENIETSGAQIVRSALTKCTFSEFNGTDVQLIRSKLNETSFHDMRWERCKITGCELLFCKVRNFAIAHGELSQSSIVKSELTTVSFPGSTVSSMDFSETRMRDMDLVELDLPNSTMMEVSIANCRWPRQQGTVSWTGRYKRSGHLMQQPVQDIYGIAPLLRREIADAQYLYELSQQDKNIVYTSILRLWGATTSYGQSITRLSAAVVVLILALSSILTIIDSQTDSGWARFWRLPSDVAAVSASFFDIGVDTTPAKPECSQPSQNQAGPTKVTPVRMDQHRETILTIARVGGFLILGLWIGIAANKVGKLSAE